MRETRRFKHERTHPASRFPERHPQLRQIHINVRLRIPSAGAGLAALAPPALIDQSLAFEGAPGCSTGEQTVATSPSVKPLGRSKIPPWDHNTPSMPNSAETFMMRMVNVKTGGASEFKTITR